MDMARFARDELAPVLGMLEGEPRERVALVLVAATLAEGLSNDDFNTACHAARVALAEFARGGRVLN